MPQNDPDHNPLFALRYPMSSLNGWVDLVDGNGAVVRTEVVRIEVSK